MVIGDLLPAALSAWVPRRRTSPAVARIDRPLTEPLRPVARDTATLTPGTASIAEETQAALSAVNGYARSRFVELQMAVEPSLVVRADPEDYRACLRQLLLAAINRASSGVLLTAVRLADGVEIAVLDDGGGACGALPDDPAPGTGARFVPAGGSLRAEYNADFGTTVRLHLPQSGRLPWPSGMDAGNAQMAHATS